MTIYKSKVVIKFDWVMDFGVLPEVRDLIKPNQDVEVRFIEDDEYTTYVLFLLNEKIGEVQSWNFEKLDSLINANNINSTKIICAHKNEISVCFEIIKKIDDIGTPKLANGDSAGIYKISINNGACLYIGQSQNINRRIKKHWESLNAGDHHNVSLQGYFQTYGKESASFEIVEVVPLTDQSSIAQQKQLEERERYWIKQLRESNLVVANATDGDFVETKKTIKETEQNKKINHLAFDLRIKVEKAKIKNDIESLKYELLQIEKNISNESNRIEPLRNKLIAIKKEVKANSGFFNRLFSSVSKLELNDLVNKEFELSLEVDNESKELRRLFDLAKDRKGTIQDLTNKRNKLRSSKQIENVGLKYIRINVEREKYFDVKNCVFSFKCSKKWDELEGTVNEKIKFCSDCNKHVYHVEDSGSYLRHIKLGECVAVFSEAKSKSLAGPTVGVPADYNSSLENEDDLPF
jgi:group I intron endonuclease